MQLDHLSAHVARLFSTDLATSALPNAPVRLEAERRPAKRTRRRP
jgi:hypothetical protein